MLNVLLILFAELFIRAVFRKIIINSFIYSDNGVSVDVIEIESSGRAIKLDKRFVFHFSIAAYPKSMLYGEIRFILS